MNEQQDTSGVQELIDRLSQEGVEAGELQASRIVNEAQVQANDILESAKRRANEIIDTGRQEAEQFQAAGHEALRLAARDAVREFASMLHDGLRNRLQELVHHQLKDPQLIRRLILEITRKATDGVKDEAVELLLPTEIITEEEARRRIEAGEEDALTEFIQGLLGEDLRERSTVGTHEESGMIIRVHDQNIEIDLTDEAIADLLAEHLLPRFRAIMRSA